MRRSSIFIEPSRRYMHACSCRRVAAVFGGDDAHDSTAAPAPPSPAPSAAASTRRTATRTQQSTVMRSLQSLFAGLPAPTAATSTRMQQLSQSPSEAAAVPVPVAAAGASASSIASAMSFAPAIAPAEAASAAQAAITYITPQFLVYVRSAASDAEQEAITPQSLLRRAFDAGLRWSVDHGITDRHIKVVTSSETGLDFSALAGFECHTAFYLTFPRHETRSTARIKMLQMGLVGTRSYLAQTMEETLGWRMMRYPAQLLIKGVPLAGANSAKPQRSINAHGLPAGLPFMGGGSHDRKLDPRTLLSMARAAGLPGWAELDESFFEDHKLQSIGGGNLATRNNQRFDYAIRVPPIAKYMDAVAAIAASAGKVRSVLGCSVLTGIADRIEGDVPMTFVEGGVPVVPVLPSSRGAAPAPRSMDATVDVSSQPSAPAAPATAAPVAKPTLASTLAAINASLSKPPSSAALRSAEELKEPDAPPVDEEPVADEEFVVPPPAFEEPAASPVPAAEEPVVPRPAPVTGATDPAPFGDSSAPSNDSSSSSSATDAPLPTPLPFGTRVYFYFINDRGQIFVEGRAADAGRSGRGNELKHARTIHVLLSNLRKSRELLTTEPRLADKLEKPRSIPVGCSLWGLSQQPAPDRATGTLPLSLFPLEYPWVSVCMGELNFIRARVTPVVFHSLRLDPKQRWAFRVHSSAGGSSAAAAERASMDSFLLSYATNRSWPFQPDKLVIDSQGLLFHPAPALPSGPACDDASLSALGLSPSAIAALSSNPNPYDLGLVESSLALELDIQELAWTEEEHERVRQIEEETRRLTIEAHEEYQRLMHRDPASINKLPDAWIADWIEAHRRGGGGDGDDLEGGVATTARMPTMPSEFVLVWQHRTFRVARLQEPVMGGTRVEEAALRANAATADATPTTAPSTGAHRRSAR